MADQDLPELESTGSGRGKQIVFLFMSAVVVAVVIFLLGVSVGRGVKRASVSAADAGDTTAAATTAASSATPTNFNYHDSLRGSAPADASKPDRAAAPVTSPVAPPSAPPPAVNEAASGKEKEKETTGPSVRTAPAPTAAANSVAPPSRGGKSTGTYSLQVGAFSTPAAARAMVSKVKAKDKTYPVSTVTLPDPAVPIRYRVMVGPYPSLDEANRMMSRLKKDGFTAVLKR